MTNQNQSSSAAAGEAETHPANTAAGPAQATLAPSARDPFDHLDPLRLPGRAQAVFARAARLQDLHGQAHLATLTQARGTGVQPRAPGAMAADSVAALQQSAAQELMEAHTVLQHAARNGRMLAAVDGEIARLDRLIHGSAPSHSPAANCEDVVDVRAVQVIHDKMSGDSHGAALPSNTKN